MSRLASFRRFRVSAGLVPTRAGAGLLVLVLALFLMAVNEGNNLLYALCFLLLSVCLVAAAQAWGHLRGLEGVALRAAPLHAGQTGTVLVLVEAGERAREGVCLAWPAQAASAPAALPPGRSELALAWHASSRGWWLLDGLCVWSEHPLGLVRAQRRLSVSGRCLVWPAPAAPEAAPSWFGAAQRAAQAQAFTGLSAWQAGDSPRRVAWKALARHAEPQVKRFDGEEGAPGLCLRWADTVGETEARLSLLTRRLLDAEAAGADWRLEMPERPAVQGPGRAAAEQALALLALHGAVSAPQRAGAAA
jgi:uncharacterized protein (DUF58 family)